MLVHGWLEQSRAEVMILTDGSGGGSVSRLGSSFRTIGDAGATLSRAWQQVSDDAVYRALLSGDGGFFCGFLDQLTDVLLDRRPAAVVGDASEGYNPSHDLCRALIDRAVARVRSLGLHVRNYAFPLISPPVLPEAGVDSIVLWLDEPALARKISAARRYPELAGEFEAIMFDRPSASPSGSPEIARLIETRIRRMKRSDLQLECLTSPDGLEADPGGNPFYELYGEQMVKLGRYRDVIRYDQHVLPILELLEAESDDRVSSPEGAANDPDDP